MHRTISNVGKLLGRPLVMSRHLSQFRVIEHVVPCQHTRHHLGGVEPGHESAMRLAVKQYIPIDRKDGSAEPDEVTIVGAHANGFPKELYEPMWEHLKQDLDAKGKKIRSIWITDIANQGQSGVLNESISGNDPNWWDHVRDLLFLINQKQGDMPQPLIGVGHSVGACHLAMLSLLHPRLLQAIVMIDPVIQQGNPGLPFAPPSTYRRDLWPSRDEAAASFRKSKYYQQWDPRVLDLWIEYGIRDLPTELYPDIEKAEDGKIPVTLTTTIAQEVYQYMRPLYKGDPFTDKDNYADFDPEVLKDSNKFYVPGTNELFRRLPEIFPPVHYIFGSQSFVSSPDLRQQKMERTGSGFGGSGGVTANKVTESILDSGHLVSMEKPKECAEAAAVYIDQQLNLWTERKRAFETAWNSRTRQQRMVLDEEWKYHIGPPPERPKKPKT